MNLSRIVKVVVTLLLAGSVLYIPYESLGVALTPVEIRVIAMFVMAAFFWILSPIPIWTTSVLVIVVSLVTLSNQCLPFLRYDEAGVVYPNLVNSKALMATFADPVIMLFLGGFFLAAAATKYHLDMNLAKVMLKPFGKNPRFVMLGIMMITAIFSMFMSNTATAAMMVAILAPVLALFDEDDKGRIAFALAIPIAANVGGMGTPIGTPPNAIALKSLGDIGASVTFGKWMAFGIPYVIILLLIAWAFLVFLFPIKKKSMELTIGGKFPRSPKAIIVYVTFVVTVILWVLGKGIVGIDENVVAMIPIAVFSVTQVITAADLKAMGWDVLWLVAGGFALGLELQQTGLAKDLIDAIPFAEWSPLGLMIGVGVICLFMANFMSHSATAALMVPIIAVVGVNLGSNLDSLGGSVALLVSVAFASSLGMSLPISTPPNAIAYNTGYVSTKGMAQSGIFIGIVGMVLTYVMMIFLAHINMFGSEKTEAEPAPVAAQVATTEPAPAPATTVVAPAPTHAQ